MAEKKTATKKAATKKAVKKAVKKKKTGRPETYTQEVLEKKAEELLNYFKDNPEKFQLSDWTIEHDYLPQHPTEWAAKSPIFSETLKKVKSILENRIVNMAQTGNTTFGIFNLKCNYGWVDKQVVEQKSEVNITGSFASAIKELGDATK